MSKSSYRLQTIDINLFDNIFDIVLCEMISNNMPCEFEIDIDFSNDFFKVNGNQKRDAYREMINNIKAIAPRVNVISHNRVSNENYSSLKLDMTRYIHKLKIEIQDTITRTLVFDNFPLNIGTNPNNEIIVSSIYASKEHAKIGFENNTFYIIDLSSRNGTFINTVKVPQGIQQKIEINDIIELGGIGGATIDFATIKIISYIRDIK